ncbi:MAG: helix-turn-helix domain-containing protein [Acidobacteriota bacterium]|nr:helix-turn-helix domain-containing protein [Acidobacteriota bacterium]
MRLRISKPSLLRLRRDGRIGYYRIGARVVYSEAEHIRPFLDSCNRQPGGNGPSNRKA